MNPSKHDHVQLNYMILFASVYAIQGVVFAYFITFNHGYMTAAGVKPEIASTVQSVVLIPFILKFLGGPISDRFNLLGFGHRKPYIVLGLVAQSLCLLALSLIDPGHQLTLFSCTAFLIVTGLALYDTCCDGMIVDITPPADRARVQGLLMGSRFLAATIFALLFGFWLQKTGNGPGKGYGVLWACAGLAVVPLAFALRLPEPARSPEAEQFTWRALRVLTRPRSLVLLAYGGFYATVGYGVEINMSPYYQSLGFGDGALGGFGATRNVGRAIGSLLLPIGVLWLGRRGVLLVAILGLSFAAMSQGTAAGLIWTGLLALAYGAANGWADAQFYVLSMEASDPKMAATTYALFMAVSNVSVAGGALFAALVTALGGNYPLAFLMASGFVLLALPAIIVLKHPPSLTANLAPEHSSV